MSKPIDAMYEYPAEWPENFVDACVLVGISATKRQWRKWCKKTGEAYTAQKKLYSGIVNN